VSDVVTRLSDALAEFDRIVAKAARRVAEFSA
jgi:hypothetical protein